MTLLELSSSLDAIIEFRDTALLAAGRVHNPLFDRTLTHQPLRKLGEGQETRIPLSKVVSRQATIHGRKVRSMKEKLKRGTLVTGGRLPEVARIGDRYQVLDGNHLIAAHLKAGRRTMKMLVQ